MVNDGITDTSRGEDLMPELSEGDEAFTPRRVQSCMLELLFHGDLPVDLDCHYFAQHAFPSICALLAKHTGKMKEAYRSGEFLLGATNAPDGNAVMLGKPSFFEE